jgi:hypothetical protein
MPLSILKADGGGVRLPVRDPDEIVLFDPS